MRPLGASSVTAKLSVAVPVSPSATEGDDTDTVGGSSSSMIVPVTAEVGAPPANAALDTADRTSVTVSSCSSKTSPATSTATVLDVSPGVNVNVPDTSV